MTKQTITLERVWGTSDEDCASFVDDLYRRLYGPGWDRPQGRSAGPIEVGPDHQDIVVVAEDQAAARLAVAQAAYEVDPAWRRLYGFAGRWAPGRAGPAGGRFQRPAEEPSASDRTRDDG
jgi:hypothetical protein